MNRPKDEANEDEKKGENDGHEGAQPVEKRYRRIITLAHLTMMTVILEMQDRPAMTNQVPSNPFGMLAAGLPDRELYDTSVMAQLG